MFRFGLTADMCHSMISDKRLFSETVTERRLNVLSLERCIIFKLGINISERKLS